MIIKETHRVLDGISGVRLSDYARTAFPMIPSRKGIAKAIKRGELWINGSPAQSGDWVQILQGVEAGESVVTSAQFLIDSEASLNASMQRMSGTQEPERRGPAND